MALVIVTGMTGCRFIQTGFQSKEQASSACYEWRSEGRVITREIQVIESGKSKTLGVRTYDRECYLDALDHRYDGYELKSRKRRNAHSSNSRYYKIIGFEYRSHE